VSRRISFAILGTVVATLLLTGVGTVIFARVQLRNDELARLEHQAERTNELLDGLALLLPALQQLNDADRAQTQAEKRAQNVRRQLLATLNLTGISEVLVSADGRIAGELPEELTQNDLDIAALSRGEILSGRSGSVLWAAAGRTAEFRGQVGTVVTIITDDEEPFFGPTLRWFTLFAIVSVALGALVSIVLGRRLSGPVLAAAVATQHIAAGDLSARIDEPDASDDDELAVLARSVNTMGEGLQRARRQERQFLMSVSHDLRTPMTSIRGYAEAIRDQATDDDAAAAAVILTESRRLERLVGDLLDLARLEADRFALSPTPADVGDVVAGTVEGFAPEFADANLTLHDEISSEPLMVTIDVDRLSQVVANLVTNAIAYARETVWTSVRLEGNDVVIQVSDDGMGIDPDDVPQVFDRLFQADNQVARRDAGSGLGLAIVRELTQRMGGTVTVASEIGRGSTFSLRLPRIPPEA
jgi:signal transduction histidine kinase